MNTELILRVLIIVAIIIILWIFDQPHLLFGFCIGAAITLTILPLTKSHLIHGGSQEQTQSNPNRPIYFITAPHAACFKSIDSRHCDKVAYPAATEFAKALQTHHPQAEIILLINNDVKRWHSNHPDSAKTTFMTETINNEQKDIADLNRDWPASLNTKFRKKFESVINQNKDNPNFWHIDVHSFPYGFLWYTARDGKNVNANGRADPEIAILDNVTTNTPFGHSREHKTANKISAELSKNDIPAYVVQGKGDGIDANALMRYSRNHGVKSLLFEFSENMDDEKITKATNIISRVISKNI